MNSAYLVLVTCSEAGGRTRARDWLWETLICTLHLPACRVMVIVSDLDLYRWVPCKSVAQELMYFVFTCMPNRGYPGRDPGLYCWVSCKSVSWELMHFVFTCMSKYGYDSGLHRCVPCKSVAWELMYFVFIWMPNNGYPRRIGSPSLGPL